MAARMCSILFPVDFSNRCVLAARHVKTWVERFGAALNTLHVIDPRALGYPADLSDDFLYNELPDLIRKRTADLKYFSDQYFGEDVATPTVLGGGTAEEIEHFAASKKIDLIMFPRNHQNIGSRFLHDSLTAKLLERCTAAVWTTEHVAVANSTSLDNILCAVHFDEDVTIDSQHYRILEQLEELVSVFHAKVTFLQVVDKPQPTTIDTLVELNTLSEDNPWLTQARQQLGDSAAFAMRSGDVITAIKETAEETAADLIVVGRTRPETIGLGVQGRILKIDHAVNCPVFSVR